VAWQPAKRLGEAELEPARRDEVRVARGQVTGDQSTFGQHGAPEAAGGAGLAVAELRAGGEALDEARRGADRFSARVCQAQAVGDVREDLGIEPRSEAAAMIEAILVGRLKVRIKAVLAREADDRVHDVQVGLAEHGDGGGREAARACGREGGDHPLIRSFAVPDQVVDRLGTVERDDQEIEDLGQLIDMRERQPGVGVERGLEAEVVGVADDLPGVAA